jgi:flagellar basal body-associated protein FliL
VIKFVLAAVWICVATLGAVFYAFQSAESKSAADEDGPLTMMGGLDYVKTEVISVPVIRDAAVEGYFLARLVYTVDPREMKKLKVPAEAVITDVVYSFVYSSPSLDFRKVKTLDPDRLRNGIREGINTRIGQQLIQDVLIEQIDYLSKEEVRDNALKRRKSSAKVVTFGQQTAEQPAEEAGPAH